MEHQDIDRDFSAVVNTISTMFGEIVNKDVILTIVESCEGDLNLSIDAIMNITSDSNYTTDKKASVTDQASTSNFTSGLSYAAKAFIPAKKAEVLETKHVQHNLGVNKVSSLNKLHFLTDKVHNIVAQHRACTKIMVIMRGAPGCGKTSLARGIVEMTVGSTYSHFNTHIFSADDYFLVKGEYIYNRFKLSEAHAWSQNRVKIAAKKGISPIIVDNTNIELWEMEPYVRDGVQEGYLIEVLEATTPWAWNANELAKRNIHNVPKATITRMIQNYSHNITGETLRDKFGLCCSIDRVPPVLSTVPIFAPELPMTASDYNVPICVDNTVLNKEPVEISTANVLDNTIPKLSKTEEIIFEPECSEGVELKANNKKEESAYLEPTIMDDMNVLQIELPVNTEDDYVMRKKLFEEAQKHLEDLQKAELEWETNECWSDDNKRNENAVKDNLPISATEPKKSRRSTNKDSFLSENFKETANECQDWSNIAMFMEPWHNPNEFEECKTGLEYTKYVDKNSCGTGFEIGDTDPLFNENKYKVLIGNPRNINEFYLPFDKEKIPDTRMLDKSSMTNDNIFNQNIRCQNEEKHFISLKKLFPKVATSDLRDIFEKCCGNVNWTVEIVFDSMANNLLITEESDDVSDIEEENIEPCQCLAAYCIIPDGQKPNITHLETDYTDILNTAGCSKDIVTPTKKKIKKGISDSSLLLKSQLEQNIVISENHYSQNYLKLKKMRHGDKVQNGPTIVSSAEIVDQELATVAETTEKSDTEQSDDEESNYSFDDVEKVVPVNLGMDFVKYLDKFFERDIIYPPNIEPKFNLRLSLLNELNAVWMESLMHQFEDQPRNTMEKDEEFARELEIKEAELLKAGKEPAVPDFKEIMDMEVAINLYQKDVEDWKNHQPTDLAAKLSREKLFNLFPEVSKDLLMELLMAHENDFRGTVEVLLNSTGRTDILGKANGVNKFIMDKEMERQQKVLEQERKALSEVEWPLLTKGEVVEMSTIHEYREKADMHLQRTNTNYNKAMEYVNRGMTNIASFYSKISSYHRQQYEYANSLAAVSLIQMNTAKNPDSTTIDLHHLHVPEARESLDIYIDFHIQKLREKALLNPGDHRTSTLFLITGRGLHSPGGPRIKPAVIRRLKERKLRCSIRNPGLLTTKVSEYDLLTNELIKQ